MTKQWKTKTGHIPNVVTVIDHFGNHIASVDASRAAALKMIVNAPVMLDALRAVVHCWDTGLAVDDATEKTVMNALAAFDA